MVSSHGYEVVGEMPILVDQERPETSVSPSMIVQSRGILNLVLAEDWMVEVNVVAIQALKRLA